jgi:hypothetical protein
MDQKKKNSVRFGVDILVVIIAFGFGRFSAPTLDRNKETVPQETELSGFKKPKGSTIEIEAVDTTAPMVAQTETLSLRARSASDAITTRQQLVAWAKEDPLGALLFAQQQVNPMSERNAAITAILHEWVKTAPQDAWLWTQENAPNDSTRLLQEMAKVDAILAWDTATQYALQFPEYMRGAYANTIKGITYTGDYLKALELIEASVIPVTGETPEGKYTFIEGLITEWVRYSPEDAAAWIASLPEDKSVRKSTAYNALLSSWATTEPADALDFALTLPDGDAKTATMTMALTYLADHDLEAATKWLNTYGDGPEFDWNIFGIATQPNVVRQDPEVAIEWAVSISQPEIREDGLVEIISQWMLNNPDEAIRYVESHEDLLSHSALQKATGKAYGRFMDASNPPTDGGIF